MSRAIDYEVPQRPGNDEARRELDQLVENLHRAGVLRLGNDLLAASPQVLEILMRGLNQEQTGNALQNLTLIAMALGRIPPERFALLSDALGRALDAMERGESGEQRAPGILGALKLLRDDSLWLGLSPLLAALRGAGEPLSDAPRKPAARRYDGAGKASNRGSDPA